MMEKEMEGEKLLLLKKGKRGIQRIIFGRTLILVLLLMIQVVMLVGVFNYLGNYLEYVLGMHTVVSTIVVLIVINRPKNPEINLSWIVLIYTVPIVGIFLYLFVETQIGNRMMNVRLEHIINKTRGYVIQDRESYEALKNEEKSMALLADYMAKKGAFNVNYGKEVMYFPSGEDKFEDLLKELEKAERFIFLEYFIIKEGVMWGKILKLLQEKVEAGVEVRVIYDGMCCMAELPIFYPKELRKIGIKCKIFEPIHPILSTHYNNRDHRKIFVIDGKVVYTGGVNLADEYINVTHPFGHWKDTAVKITGKAVDDYTLMFLQMWNMKPDRDKKGKVIEENYIKYLDLWNVNETDDLDIEKKNNGYVIPYTDSPLDNELLGEMVYMHIVNRACKYVYFMTPYLILDHDMMTAITFAAKKGVDVRVIIPGKPDKKYAYALAQNQYKELIKAGVRLYEYTPGFIHAKVCVSDDDIATVGTINLDYRSLYLNFECGALLYKCSEIGRIKEDVLTTIEVCQEKTISNYKKGKLGLRIIGKVIKPFGPLM